MGVLDTTYTFTATDVVTSAKLNNVIDQTTFTSNAVATGNTTLAVTASGQLKVNSNGITPNEVSNGNYAINVTGSSASCTGNAATSSSCTGNSATATNATNATLANKASVLSNGGSNGNSMQFNYAGQSGQPTWVWGSNDVSLGQNNYVWNPSNFNVAYATRAANGPADGTFYLSHSANNAKMYIGGFSPNSQGYGIQFNALAATAAACLFDLNNVNKGAINITATGVNFFSQSSDYRLKTDYLPIENAVNRIDSLNPVNFKWIEDGTRDEGFIAHELQAVVPSAVSGEKDEVDSDNNPVMQKIDRTHLIPLLTAAIQELSARVKSLESAVI